jgi:hypothetical protein
MPYCRDLGRDGFGLVGSSGGAAKTIVAKPTNMAKVPATFAIVSALGRMDPFPFDQNLFSQSSSSNYPAPRLEPLEPANS